MKYYIYEWTTNTKVVGYVSWGQLELDESKVMTSFLASMKYIDKNPNLKMSFYKRAKITDVMRCFNIGLVNNAIISERHKSILEKFNLQSCQFFKIDILNSKTNKNYFVLHFYNNPISYAIDFEKSTFFESDLVETLSEENRIFHTVIDYNDYLRQEKVLKANMLSLLIDKIVLKKTVSPQLDMFTLFPKDDKIYVSENLKNELVNAGISGLEEFVVASNVC